MTGQDIPKAALCATRAAGLARLQAFRPDMGAGYASGRNFDHGPGRHHRVSGLSPYLRRRLVTEREAISAALEAHGAQGAEKFIQEVVWRGYFKGWLEHRPEIWRAYGAGLGADLAQAEQDSRLHARISAAESGASGIECVDFWARELRETGYLHNHGRMWFASIWIFTLGLPWRVGADFFLRHLIDGDPASNTLSWRWVAGLHTRGKAFGASTANIAQYTNGRFRLAPGELAEEVAALSEEPEGLPPVQPLRAPLAPQPGMPSALLITEEDCQPGDFDLSALDLRGCASLSASALRSPRPVSPLVTGFERAALADAAQQLPGPVQRLHVDQGASLLHWARSLGAAQIVTPYIPMGPLRDWITGQEAALAQAGIRFCELRRGWDGSVWPHATAGFFKVKKQIPGILKANGLGMHV